MPDPLTYTPDSATRAFVRADTVHLRDRFNGVVLCGANEREAEGEPGDDNYRPAQPLADGPTPQEAGKGVDAYEWPWCPNCRAAGIASGVLVLAVDEG